MEFYQGSNDFTPTINKLKFKDGLNIFWDAFCLWKKAPFTLCAMMICTVLLAYLGPIWIADAWRHNGSDSWLVNVVGMMGFIFIAISIPFAGSFTYSAARLEAGGKLKFRHLVEGLKHKLTGQFIFSFVSSTYIALLGLLLNTVVNELGANSGIILIVYVVVLITLLIPGLFAFWVALPLYRWSSLDLVGAGVFSLKAYAKNMVVLTLVWMLPIMLLSMFYAMGIGFLAVVLSPLLVVAFYTTFRKTIKLASKD